MNLGRCRFTLNSCSSDSLTACQGLQGVMYVPRRLHVSSLSISSRSCLSPQSADFALMLLFPSFENTASHSILITRTSETNYPFGVRLETFVGLGGIMTQKNNTKDFPADGAPHFPICIYFLFPLSSLTLVDMTEGGEETKASFEPCLC